MTRPWKIIDRVTTAEGILELRQRAAKDFLITVAGRVLMNSQAHRSEAALGRLACRHAEKRPTPRILVGGLGMGYTLRHVLDNLPVAARVTVAELNPAVLGWCRGPLSDLTAGAVGDPRVAVEIGDVADLIQRSARGSRKQKFDAIVLDLYTGPHSRTHKRDDPLYGSRAIETTRAALAPGGVFAIWGEESDQGFIRRLQACGLQTTVEQPKKGGPRHVVYLARLQTPGEKSAVFKSEIRSRNRRPCG